MISRTASHLHRSRIAKTAAQISCLVFILILASCVLTGCGPKNAPPSQVLNQEDAFSLELTYLADIPKTGSFRILQGGCVTQEHAYFAMLSDENFNSYILSKCYIIKYDRHTMQELCRSEVMSLGHANDITYIPESNELYVVHCVNRKVSILDADTLTVKRTDRLQRLDSYAISYNPSRDQFVSGIATAGMGFFDSELNVVGSAKELDTTLVTQGICSDDKYIYHIMYSTKTNTEEPMHMIFVRDWEGNLITSIPVGLKDCEPENISLVGDTFYIAVNNSDKTGGVVYTGKLTKNEG